MCDLPSFRRRKAARDAAIPLAAQFGGGLIAIYRVEKERAFYV
jgi:hypothetical protein